MGVAIPIKTCDFLLPRELPEGSSSVPLFGGSSHLVSADYMGLNIHILIYVIQYIYKYIEIYINIKVINGISDESGTSIPSGQPDQISPDLLKDLLELPRCAFSHLSCCPHSRMALA